MRWRDGRLKRLTDEGNSATGKSSEIKGSAEPCCARGKDLDV